MNIDTQYSLYLSHPAICTDTRNITPGCLFFCLRGGSFDGNEFANTAVELGAAFVITENTNLQGESFIHTADALFALQQLAAHHRRHLNIPVIGITGTNGKTTTKELLKAVLQNTFRTCATTGNLNNHIGVPLTLLNIGNDCELAIVEMGANHPGEIAELCTIAHPNYGIITNIGKAHLEGFGTIENIIATKNALYLSVSENGGTLFVNGDNELLCRLSEGTTRSLFGTNQAFDCYGEIIAADPLLTVRWKQHVIHTQLAGAYNFENVMSAICAASHFRVPDTEIVAAIEGYKPSNSRSQVMQTNNNYVILDAYNANPTSMEAALENFNGMNAAKKAVLLGDMLELGDVSEAEHLRIVEKLQSMKFDVVLLTGPVFSKVCKNKSWHCFATSDEAGAWLREHRVKGFSILVKGSRGIQLEKAVTEL